MLEIYYLILVYLAFQLSNRNDALYFFIPYF